MDTLIFSAVNGLAVHSPLLDWLGIFFAVPFVYIFCTAAASLWAVKAYRPQVYAAAASVLVSRGIIVEILKRLVDRPRPYQAVGEHTLLIDIEKGLSFSSGHTVVFFAIAFSFYGTKLFWPLVVLASLGSLSRIYVGVHYPSDVAFSILIAAAVAWGTRKFFKKHQKT